MVVEIAVYTYLVIAFQSLSELGHLDLHFASRYCHRLFRFSCRHCHCLRVFAERMGVFGSHVVPFGCMALLEARLYSCTLVDMVGLYLANSLLQLLLRMDSVQGKG